MNFWQLLAMATFWAMGVSLAGDAVGAQHAAKIRIGGEMRAQYATGWASDYDRPAKGGAANYPAAGAGWAITRAELNFTLDLSADTSAFAGLRWEGRGATGWANIVDNVYWEWRRPGGIDGTLRVGLADVPFGLFGNADAGGYRYGGRRATLISRPLFANVNKTYAGGMQNFFGVTGAGNRYGDANIGIYFDKKWDEWLWRGGVMASNIKELDGARTTADNDAGVTKSNELRNYGLDHVTALIYQPRSSGWHLETSYLGQFDADKGAGHRDFARRQFGGIDGAGDGAYTASWSLAATYQATPRWKLFGETVLTWQPAFIEGFNYGATLGADYRLTERLTLGAAFEVMNTDYARRDWMPLNGAEWYRANVGGKYEFGNGIYAKWQYYRDWVRETGGYDDRWKNADVFIFETGFRF
jgi:hypothetical protein